MSAFYDELRRRYSDPAAFVRALQMRMRLYGVCQAQLAKASGFPPPRICGWLGPHPVGLPDLRTMAILDEALEKLERGES